ncbi:GTPase [Stenotrophomonas sp. 24(2023)]|uniref:GTP-binding protein n=1 Tax=Stenotrophomonas sp. 24(2023) TaxID=3068324 RepID=UPI0027DF6C49|nr:GTPase [Stenotrophomonas sp. 24(2023)]WMJ69894.1 GTPase [Stenotrophomonas sp. 24(2023)]
MREHKVVVMGPLGVGKSTLVQTLTQGQAVATEARNSDPSVGKEFTTVALDYGDIALPGGDRLRLYGTPGQQRFSYLWPILLAGAQGAIVLVDAGTHPGTAQAAMYLQAIAEAAPRLPVVIGVTRCDDNLPALRAWETWLQMHAPSLPVMPLDPRQMPQAMILMDVLMSQIECNAMVTIDE